MTAAGDGIICISTADLAHSERIECVHDHVHSVGEAELQPCNPIDEGDELVSGYRRELDIEHDFLRGAGSSRAVIVDCSHFGGESKSEDRRR